ncbi:MAG: HAMP domain-containing protein [Anaerolineae bacterium]|nr:HAMP domain-containing protein [Anaerolineae bacterium]
MSFLNNIRMKTKLIGLFLVVGILPLIAATGIGIWRSGQALQQQAFDQMVSVKEIKKGQIETYFSEREGDIAVLLNSVKALEQEGLSKLSAIQSSKRARLEDYFANLRGELLSFRNDPNLQEAMLEFNAAFESAGDSVDTAEWRAVSRKYAPRLQAIVQDKGWEDLLLIHTDGDIVYTAKQESDLGMVIPNSELADTSLGIAFQAAQSMAAGDVAIGDFAAYAPAGGTPAAFMMTQMRDITGTVQGYIAMRLPLGHINTITQDRTGLGDTGETYIVGKVGAISSYRSDRVVKTGKMGDVRSGGYVDKGLTGESGLETKVGVNGDLELTAYQPLNIPGLNWAMFTTIALEEVIAPTFEGETTDFFTNYINEYGYHDLFLIDATGYVFYTVQREADYETNILKGEYSNTNLGRLVGEVLESQQFGIADYDAYAPSGGAQASFIARPLIENGVVEFVVALQLPYEHIDAIIQERTGMGDTGESYLVGRHNGVTAFRSDLVTMGDGQYVVGYEFTTPYIDDALAGNSNQEVTKDSTGAEVLVAYSPLEIRGLNWGIVSKINQGEVREPVNELIQILLIIGVFIAFVVAVLALVFANSIANPLQVITQGAKFLSVGDAELSGMDWSSIVQIRQRKDELGQIGQAFSDLIDYFKNGAATMQLMAAGDLSVSAKPRGETDLMGNALLSMQQSVGGMVAGVGSLIQATVAGQLDARADASQFEGAYHTIIQGFNDTLDAVIGPLNMAAEYIERISNGDIPDPITDEYYGDFNEIKNNLNVCIAVLNSLIDETNILTASAVRGQWDARGDAAKFQGGYAQIVQGVNNTLDALIGPLNVAAEYVERIGNGDIPEIITDEYYGDFNEIKNNLNMCISAVNALVVDANMLSDAAAAERFTTRADVERHQGDFRKIIQGVNHTMDIVVNKVFWYQQILDSLPWPLSVTDLDMNWTFINRAVEKLTGLKRENILGLQCSNWNADICKTKDCGIARLRHGELQTFFAQQGKNFQVDTAYILSTQGEQIGHIEMIQDITDKTRVSDYQDAEVDRLASRLSQLAQGDLSFALNIADADTYTQAVHSNFLRINDSLGQVKDAVGALIKDAQMLTDAATKGQLSTRADVSHHNGEFRTIIQGVNSTMDAVIGPLNVAAEYVNQIVQGEIPHPITTDYQGDFGVFKNNLNALSASLREMLTNIQLASNELAAASAQILAATTQQASGASEQSAAITQATTTVDEVRTISEQAVMRAQEVADSSQRTVQVSRSGRMAVDETMGSMNRIKEQVEGIAENILALSDQTQQIGEITATVNDIASQSNMLALNASVEAARAGEHGKGFAVVAMEVRNLAEQSKQATAQVRAILTDIQNAINASVMVTEEGSKVVDDGVTRASQTREAIEQLSSVITESAQIAAQVVAGGQQQSSGVEQIAMAMQNINQAMVQSMASTRQAEKSAQDLNQLANKLNNTVKQYKLNGKS